MLMAFIIGVSAGAFTVNGLSTVQRDELTNYFHGFLQLLDNQNVESVELFSIAIKDNLKNHCTPVGTGSHNYWHTLYIYNFAGQGVYNRL